MPQEHVEPILIGRDRECSALAGLLAGDVSPALALVHGEAGIGKTTLLSWARDLAGQAGARTLSGRGAPTEADLTFAGLHQLLHPLLDRTGPTLQAQDDVRDALRAQEAAGSAIFRTGFAVLELLAEASLRERLVVVVDDVQWWDRPSRDVLAFVARRLAEDPVALVVAARDPVPAELEQLAIGDQWLRLPLARLDDEEAGALLDRVAPGLPPDVRRHVLDEAAGNPLALKELPHTAVDAAPAHALHPEPVSDRLEAAFAARVHQLPEAAQALVLLAAAHDSEDVGELLAAGAQLSGRTVTLDDLEPAVAVGLLEAGPGAVRFCHPLARSAVYQRAGAAARQAAHRALARTTISADRRAWHAAGAATGPDEAVAVQLDGVAERASHVGAKDIATRAIEEAARLSESPARRATRLLQAVQTAFDGGDYEHAQRLLGSVDAGAVEPDERLLLDWLRELVTQGPWTGGDRVAAFADIADRMAAAGQRRRAVRLLLGLSLRCWWSNIAPATSTRVAEVADRLRQGEDDPEHLAITATAAPVERGAEALATFGRLAVADLAPDAGLLMALGVSGTAVGDHPRAATVLAAAIAEARSQGQTGVLARALVALAWAETHLGRLGRAEIDGEEGVRLAGESGQPLWVATGELALASARGLRGRAGDADAIAGRAERVYLAAGANPMLAQVQAARGFAALGAGRYEDALAHLRRIFSPADASYHLHLRTFLVSEIALAAAHCGEHDRARRLLVAMEERLTRTSSPILRAGLFVARPLLAEPARVGQRYDEALADGLTQWPLHRARLLLGYGAWLRRGRRISEARGPLHDAHETFTAIGAAHWAERAAQELRAAGELDPVREAPAWERLTPQELQIAQLAAAGLTNRQIGERLFLSHRTVGLHLYHVFPKLGISSRAQLHTALAGVEPPDPA